MKLEKGDVLIFTRGGLPYSANDGAKAIFTGETCTHEDGGHLISVGWIRNGDDNEQIDGKYYLHMFEKVEEVSTQEVDRIFEENKEKNMKVEYNFLDGVARVKTYLEDHLELTKDHLLEQAARATNIDHLRKLVNDFDMYERTVEQAIENLDEAGSIPEVLDAVEDTVLGGSNTLIIGLLLNIEIKAI